MVSSFSQILVAYCLIDLTFILIEQIKWNPKFFQAKITCFSLQNFIFLRRVVKRERAQSYETVP